MNESGELADIRGAKGNRSRAALLLKGLVSAGLVAILAKNIDLKAMSFRVLVADPGWMLV